MPIPHPSRDNYLLNLKTGLNFWLNAHDTVSQLLQAFAQSAEFVSTAAKAIIAYQNAEAVGMAPISGSLFSPDPVMTYSPYDYGYYGGAERIAPETLDAAVPAHGVIALGV